MDTVERRELLTIRTKPGPEQPSILRVDARFTPQPLEMCFPTGFPTQLFSPFVVPTPRGEQEALEVVEIQAATLFANEMQ
jgi:hypothetical protein